MEVRTSSWARSEGRVSSSRRRPTSATSCDDRYSSSTRRNCARAVLRSTCEPPSGTRPARRRRAWAMTSEAAGREATSAAMRSRWASGSSPSRCESARKCDSSDGALGMSSIKSSSPSRSARKPSPTCAEERTPRACMVAKRMAIISRSRPALSIASVTPRLITWKWNCCASISSTHRVASRRSPPLRNSRRHASRRLLKSSTVVAADTPRRVDSSSGGSTSARPSHSAIHLRLPSCADADWTEGALGSASPSSAGGGGPSACERKVVSGSVVAFFFCFIVPPSPPRR